MKNSVKLQSLMERSSSVVFATKLINNGMKLRNNIFSVYVYKSDDKKADPKVKELYGCKDKVKVILLCLAFVE